MSGVRPGNHVLGGAGTMLLRELALLELCRRLKIVVNHRLLDFGNGVNSAKVGGPILTIFMSYDVYHRKDAPLGVLLICLPN